MKLKCGNLRFSRTTLSFPHSFGQFNTKVIRNILRNELETGQVTWTETPNHLIWPKIHSTDFRPGLIWNDIKAVSIWLEETWPGLYTWIQNLSKYSLLAKRLCSALQCCKNQDFKTCCTRCFLQTVCNNSHTLIQKTFLEENVSREPIDWIRLATAIELEQKSSNLIQSNKKKFVLRNHTPWKCNVTKTWSNNLLKLYTFVWWDWKLFIEKVRYQRTWPIYRRSEVQIQWVLKDYYFELQNGAKRRIVTLSCIVVASSWGMRWFLSLDMESGLSKCKTSTADCWDEKFYERSSRLNFEASKVGSLRFSFFSQ